MFRESNTPYFIRSSVLRSYFFFFVKGVLNFKLLTQHILRASSVGAGSLSLKTETYIAIIRLPGKESNLTQPMNTIQHSIRNTTHYSFYRHLRRDAFTTSDTLSCRSSEAGFAISLHSLLILYQNQTPLSSLFSLFFSFILLEVFPLRAARFVPLSLLLFHFHDDLFIDLRYA